MARRSMGYGRVKMDLMDQLRTTQGRFPVRLAECSLEGGLSQANIRFAFDDSGAVAADGAKSKNGGRLREFSVEDLAFLYGSDGRLDHMVISDLALRSGPLFGAHAEEAVADWVTESHMIKDVVTLQEVLNGQKSYMLVNGNLETGQGALVAKSHVRNPVTHNSFDMYSFTVNIVEGTTDAFFSEMSSFPHFKKFSTAGMYDYAFFDKGRDDDGSFLTVTLFAFKREITAHDFAVVVNTFSEEEDAGEDSFEELWEQASKEIGLSQSELPANYYGLSDELEIVDALSDKKDAPHLQKLVHAIISLHLQGIGIDVFRSTESDDFMVFPNYLSYLWYRFSRQLGQVKIGYCEMCGRGFSLAGHRGIARSFCSERCKTKAKNDRVRRQRDSCRELFIQQQMSVLQVAKTVYAEELSDNVRTNKKKTIDQAVKLVQKSLRGYPAFKHLVDEDLLAGKGAPFVRRCVEEGVLSAKDVAERIKALGIEPKG